MTASDLGNRHKKKALLLGAGFSYELGMPLGSEFTRLFFSFLTEKKLGGILERAVDWRPYGPDKPLDPQILQRIAEIHRAFLSSGSVNYEDFFRELEDRERSCYKSPERDTYSAIIQKLKSLVNESFWLCQANSFPQYLRNRNLYECFLKELADEELWIFSLNHDVIIEMLCIDYGISLSMGAQEKAEYPWSNKATDKSIRFDTWDSVEKDVNRLNFIHGEKGINLIKLHGGINEFIHGDDVSNPRRSMVISWEDTQSSFQYTQQVGEMLHEDHYYLRGIPIRLGEEIAFSDNTGQMNFMRPTILTGGHKYQKTLQSVSHEEKMDLFSSGLSQIDELYIIGYSFGDGHINHRIEHAMHLNEQMTVWEIRPGTYRYEGFETFDYGLRVRGVQTGFPQATGYLLDKKWDADIEKQLEENKVIRETVYKRMEEQIFRRQ